MWQKAFYVGLLVVLIVPTGAFAFSLSDILGKSVEAASVDGGPTVSSSKTPALVPAHNIDPNPAKGGADIVTVGGALVSAAGPEGTMADIEDQKPSPDQISIYVVRSGDTLSSIGKLFGVSASTILWANDLKNSKDFKVGDTLVILPVTGVKYTVAKGDTMAKIAKKFGADASEITDFNGIQGALIVGTEIIIPDGEIAAASAPATTKKGTAIYEPAHNVGPVGTAVQIGYYMAPLGSYKETQGIHGYNAVDLGAPSGTPIYASAAGQVIIARAGGYNGGYGSYVVIQHDNGSQTLYAHMSKVITSVGSSVVQGQVIGYVGSTGKSTGSHLHFEIRNGIRNPF